MKELIDENKILNDDNKKLAEETFSQESHIKLLLKEIDE
jgi:hypothetical protein